MVQRKGDVTYRQYLCQLLHSVHVLLLCYCCTLSMPFRCVPRTHRQPLAGSEAALMVQRKGDNVHSVARPAVSTQGAPPFIAHEMARCAADRAVVG